MSTPTVRYKYIEEVEVLEDYRPGGYHPVQINDTLRHDRYQIVHKPGHGTFSTAWLALNRNSSTYVAVKVGASYADKNEVDILSRLAMTDVARSLAVQVIKAVAHVHSRVYAHGDLHLGNLLLRLPASLNNLSIDQLYAKFGAPKLKPIARLDGCLIFELFAHRSLIDGIIAPQDDITAQQVHLQGIPPPEWWDKWDKRSKWFDNKGQALSNEQDIWSWDRRFRQWIQEPRKSEGMETINSEEAAALLDLLKRMLAWKPENRPQAQQILESGWVKEWALPAYNKTKRTPEVERA
ncbi:serine/threonine protein kinase [Fusarium oxysporum f. sp. lycopersici 4287]|uniref:non-specific serine/threonine protein kinase n=2 Tax=Fusarium oxysporum TaxID=5507 RepID=A0A0J9VVE7_FUSO4|nr:serine/threonine protein kinase [Fusarium oxysporum f. sp. lycopersici 4287]EXK36081.1 serine/threonine protein kinase [Fusarium oxysporum f. sp. melonis 26406]KNB14778.1 serine/threonine protein kinase [Fusarium oxysporum f. sp. lycopersici 4287]